MLTWSDASVVLDLRQPDPPQISYDAQLFQGNITHVLTSQVKVLDSVPGV